MTVSLLCEAVVPFSRATFSFLLHHRNLSLFFFSRIQNSLLNSSSSSFLDLLFPPLHSVSMGRGGVRTPHPPSLSHMCACRKDLRTPHSPLLSILRILQLKHRTSHISFLERRQQSSKEKPDFHTRDQRLSISCSLSRATLSRELATGPSFSLFLCLLVHR